MAKVATVAKGTNRRCELNKQSKISMMHIGGDYIGVKVDDEYHEVDGFAQHIIWELLRRLERGVKAQCLSQ